MFGKNLPVQMEGQIAAVLEDAAMAREPLVSGPAPVLWFGFAVFAVIFFVVLVLVIRNRVIRPARRRASEKQEFFAPAGDEEDTDREMPGASAEEQLQWKEDKGIEGEDALHEGSLNERGQAGLEQHSNEPIDETLDDAPFTERVDIDAHASAHEQPAKELPQALSEHAGAGNYHDEDITSLHSKAAREEEWSGEQTSGAPQGDDVNSPDTGSGRQFAQERENLLQLSREHAEREADFNRRKTEAAIEQRMQAITALSEKMNDKTKALSLDARKIEAHLGEAIDARMGMISQQINDALAAIGDKSSQDGGAEASQNALSLLRKEFLNEIKEMRASTLDAFSTLNERIEKIDPAAGVSAELSRQIASLNQAIAVRAPAETGGRLQLAEIVRAALPAGRYTLSKKLSNNRIADCLVFAPMGRKPIAVNARFPVEEFDSYIKARAQNNAAKTENDYRRSLLRHIVDISTNLISPGETADAALMFAPSEIIFNDLHVNFKDVVQDAYRARVWIVSPTSLMAVLTAVNAVIDVIAPQEGILDKPLNASVSKQLDGLRERIARLEERATKDEVVNGVTQAHVQEHDAGADDDANLSGEAAQQLQEPANDENNA